MNYYADSFEVKTGNKVINGLSGLLHNYDDLISQLEFFKHEARYYHEECCKQDKLIEHWRGLLISEQQRNEPSNLLRARMEALKPIVVQINFNDLFLTAEQKEKIAEIITRKEEK